MELYLVRHARAFEADPAKWPDDRDRPLSPLGEDEFRRAASALAKLALGVELVLCSPALRAQQTAAILRQEAAWPAATLHEPLAGAGAEDLLESLGGFADAGSIALIGHDPFLGWLGSLLIAGSGDAATIKMRPGAIAHVLVEGGLGPGAGSLVRLIQSADLARI